ncbi:MAG: IS110 family transposase [Propionibacteriaceae bacterium]|jgi:transposase|nr:IS110 family transposase [Propionibacteriaceae bacterium]
MKRAITWIRHQVTSETLTVIECAGSYGATLASLLTSEGFTVVESHPTPARMRAGRGKSDPVDAGLIARSVLGVDTTMLRNPRQDNGHRGASHTFARHTSSGIG